MASKYKFNKSFFDKIDKGYKAYYLGLLITDGTVRHKNGWDCRLRFQKSDIMELKKFQTIIKSNAPIYHEKGNKKKQRGNMVTLGLGGKDFILNLSKYNIKPNKTHNVSFPKIKYLPKNLYPDFIRGVFDGDGTIEKKKGQIQIYSGSKKFLSEIESVINTNKIKNTRLVKGATTYILRINASGYYGEGSAWDQANPNRIACLNVLKMYQFLYYNKTRYCFVRKKKIFENLILKRNKGKLLKKDLNTKIS